MRIAILAAAVLGLSACTDTSEDRTEVDGPGGTVRTEGSGADQTVIVEGDQGGTVVTGAGAEAAANAPAYAQPYPGAEVTSAVQAPGDAGGMVMFRSDANPDTIINYYRQRAEEAGMGAGAVTSSGGTRQYAAEADSGAGMAVVIVPSGGSSTVTVTWDAAG